MERLGAWNDSPEDGKAGHAAGAKVHGANAKDERDDCYGCYGVFGYCKPFALPHGLVFVRLSD